MAKNNCIHIHGTHYSLYHPLANWNSLIRRLLPLRKARDGTFIVCDVKGRHDLITQEWIKAGTHTCSKSTFTTVFFSGRYGFSASFSPLQSVKHTCNCPHRINQFLKSVLTTQSIVSLAYSTQQNTNFLANQPVRCHVWHSWDATTSVYLAIFMVAVTNKCCGIIGYECTYHKHGLWAVRADFHVCPHAVKLCLPYVYPLKSKVIKCTRLSPTIAGNEAKTEMVVPCEYIHVHAGSHKQ